MRKRGLGEDGEGESGWGHGWEEEGNGWVWVWHTVGVDAGCGCGVVRGCDVCGGEGGGGRREVRICSFIPPRLLV